MSNPEGLLPVFFSNNPYLISQVSKNTACKCSCGLTGQSAQSAIHFSTVGRFLPTGLPELQVDLELFELTFRNSYLASPKYGTR